MHFPTFSATYYFPSNQTLTLYSHHLKRAAGSDTQRSASDREVEMEEEEHEVYGGDIPDVGEDVDMATADDDAVKVMYLFIY